MLRRLLRGASCTTVLYGEFSGIERHRMHRFHLQALLNVFPFLNHARVRESILSRFRQSVDSELNHFLLNRDEPAHSPKSRIARISNEPAMDQRANPAIWNVGRCIG
jgi:hypothetical protein